jgi:hypothetical protein
MIIRQPTVTEHPRWLQAEGTKERDFRRFVPMPMLATVRVSQDQAGNNRAAVFDLACQSGLL